jgi:hypothetical protein
MQTIEQKKCLASIALFGEISKKNYDIYITLSIFIRYLIAQNKLYDFSALEIKRDLSTSFGFSIPENVIKNALKRFSGEVILNNKRYHVVKKVDLGINFDERQIEISMHQANVVENINKYIESKYKRLLNTTEKEAVFNSIYNFLLDGGYSTDIYTKYISSYVIENSENKELIASLNIVKEGVLLFSGFQYSPEEYSKNTWNFPLVLYFDTEILFSLYGFNGELYKTLVLELIELINKVNKKSLKETSVKIIKLKYFDEIKNEIDTFFRAAISIIKCEDRPVQRTQAMKNVINGCETHVDVLRKKALFFEKLESYGFEHDTEDYYKLEYHQYNIESKEIIEQIFAEYESRYSKVEMEYGMNLLNKISILRREKKDKFIDAKYFLVTANSMYFELANHSLIINGGIVPAVSPVELITEKIWIKINTGLAPSKVKSFDVILRSQFVVSTQMNISVTKKMAEVEKLYKEEKININQANAVLTELRQYIAISENINQENVEQGIEFTETSINKFIENYNILEEKVQKVESENDRIAEDLKRKNERLFFFEQREEKRQNQIKFVIKIFKRTIVLTLSILFILLVYYINTQRSIGWVSYILYTIGTISSLIGILRAFGIEIKAVFRKLF